MERLLTLPWDRLSRAEQRLALVQAELHGDADAACFDAHLADDWRDRMAAWLVDNPELSPEQAIYLELVVEPHEARQAMDPEGLAYWRDGRSRRDPRVATLAYAWWGSVVITLSSPTAEPWEGGSGLVIGTAAAKELARV